MCGGPPRTAAMDEDLEFLLGFAGGDAAVVEAAADADLDMLVALAPPPGPAERRHAPRSWQLCEKARAAKKSKAKDAKVAMADAAKERAEHALKALSIMCPAAAARLKIGLPRGAMDENRAEIVAVLALSPTLTSSTIAIRTQRRAVSLVAETALQVQSEWCDKVFGSLRLDSDLSAAPDAVLAPVAPLCVCLTWQWDETAQKTKNVLGHRLREERKSDAKVATQTLMQSGKVVVYTPLPGGGGTVSFPEPVLCRGTFLPSTTADNILEAILRRYPLPLEDEGALAATLSGDGLLILSFAHDRAASNYLALRWLFRLLIRPSVPKTIFPHAEACVLHGLQLARTRPPVGKGLVGATFSFTRFLRNWRSRESLRTEILLTVPGLVDLERRPRSKAVSAQQDAALNVMFGDEAAVEGGKKNPFRQDVRLVLDLVDLHPGRLVHPCPRASVADRTPGCCDTLGVALEKICVAVLNALLSKSWVVGAENKWTHTLRVLARFVLGCLLGGVLPASLDGVRRFVGVAPDLEHQLAALVALETDQPHSEASRRLRLIRICKTLCHADAPWQAAIMVTGLRRMDNFMYRVFGVDAAERPLLLDLLGWRTPRFAELQADLWGLLLNYGVPVSTSWVLLRLTGCDLSAGSVRNFTRAFLLQLLGSLHDHFGIKWGKPPYTLLPLLEPDVPLAEKRRRATAFLSEPFHCKSLFLKRLQARCPTVAAVLNEGTHVLRAWNASILLGIDAVERSHWALRLQLRSPVRARNATTSCNTVFLQEAAAEHCKRHGQRPSSGVPALGALTDTVAAAAAPAEPSRRGGNSRFAFNNHKTAAYKRAVAPDRAMTQVERQDAQQRAAAEWGGASPETKDHWETVHQAAVLRRGLVPLADAAAAPPAVAKNLWDGPTAPNALVPASRVVEEYKKRPFKERDSRANHEPTLFVEGPVDARTRGMHKDEVFDPEPNRLAAISSCWESKKNICRHAVGAPRARLMNDLCSRFNGWVTDLGVSAQECTGLLLLRGSGAASSNPDGPSSQLDSIVLLVLHRGSPKMQIFARCFVEGAAEGVVVCPLGPVPFHVQLQAGPSPLCSRVRVLRMCTSDDLAFDLTAVRSQWHLVPLVWVESTPEPSLVRFCVVGRGRPGERLVRQPKRARAANDMLEALHLLEGRPWRGPSSAIGMPVAAAAEEGDDDGSDDDNDPFYGIPAEYVEDVAAEFAETLGVGPDADECDSAEAVAEEAGPAHEESDPDGEAVVVEAAAAAAVVAAAWVFDEAAYAAAVVDAKGFVTCPVPPWCDLVQVGKITSWPKDLPLAKRSFSCRCLAHAGCKTPAKKGVTQAWILQWLFSGKCEPMCIGSRSAVLREQHEKAFVPVIARLRAAAAASSSAARSSADAAAAS